MEKGESNKILFVFVLLLLISYGIFQLYINRPQSVREPLQAPAQVPAKTPPQVPLGTPGPLSNIRPLGLSPEGSGITLSFAKMPDFVSRGEEITVEWHVNSDKYKDIFYTAIYYDYESHPAKLGNVPPSSTGYKYITTDFVAGKYKIPSSFSTEFQVDEVPVYIRAHAIVDGKNYWTPEKKLDLPQDFVPINIGPKPTAPS
jgi:hypothetical protein